MQGLEEYLKKTSIGKEILKAYKQAVANNTIILPTIRSKLVRLVITREKDKALKNITEDEALDKFM